jgi:hypothetical protein
VTPVTSVLKGLLVQLAHKVQLELKVHRATLVQQALLELKVHRVCKAILAQLVRLAQRARLVFKDQQELQDLKV